ncbi:MAG: ABC transporter ATP-binding protein [Verrucomicrobiae bacterium]|nr:ABC transporter ATP-binding protein [Verrucomicrobiae bacterium]
MIPDPQSRVSLELVNVKRRYAESSGPLVVLDGVSMIMKPGETVAVVGPSGSGKSTLLNIIGGLDVADEGEVRFGNMDVGSLKGEAMDAYRRFQVGFVFQEHHLLPQLTALENVLLPALGLPAAGAEGMSRAMELLDRVGLAAHSRAFPWQMSGGERQRVAVIRALLNRPRLLLADEPTGNLDDENGCQVMRLLLELAGQEQSMVLLVTHQMEQARQLSRLLELSRGRLVERTPPP